MSRLRNLGIALEDNEEDQLPKEENQEAVSGELISDASEVSQDANETGELINAMEEMGDDLEDLEKVQDVAQGTLEEGTKEGMDPVTAQMTDIAVEAIRERLGFASKYQKVSLEAFGSKTSRIAATNVAVEGIGETIQKALSGVLRVIKEVIDRILAFFRRILGLNEKLIPVIEKLIANAKTILREGKKTSETIIEDEALAKVFFSGDFKQLIKSHLVFSEAVAELNKGMDSLPTKLGSKVIAATVFNNSADNVVKAIISVVTEYFKPLAPVFPHKKGDMVESNPLFDGTRATAEMPKDGLSFPKIAFIEPNVKGSDMTKLKVLSPEDQISLLEELKKVIEASDSIVKMDKDIKKFGEGCAKTTEEAIKKDKNATEADKALISEIVGLYRSSTAMFASVNLHIPAKNAAFTKAFCQYIQASQKLYA